MDLSTFRDLQCWKILGPHSQWQNPWHQLQGRQGRERSPVYIQYGVFPHKSYLRTQFINKPNSKVYCNESISKHRRTTICGNITPFLRVERVCVCYFLFPFFFFFTISWFFSLANSDHVTRPFLHFHSKDCKSYALYAEFYTEKHASNRNLVTLATYCEQANIMINRKGMMPGNLRKFKAKQMKCVLISWWKFVCYIYQRGTSSQSNLDPQTFFLHSEL